ncbi:MAG TPA: hypothetical protein VIC82_14505 [Candidatus Nanopelagicales bacterium]|jgi:hypothetical protein
MATAVPVVRSVGLLRVGWGVVMLLRPGAVLTAVTGRDSIGQAESFVVQVLGAREVLQGSVTALFPRRSLLRWGVAVDATHAASMAGLAAVKPNRKVPALTSAAIATVELVVGARLARKLS